MQRAFGLLQKTMQWNAKGLILMITVVMLLNGENYLDRMQMNVQSIPFASFSRCISSKKFTTTDAQKGM